jgi:hypothetical protein
MDMTVLVALIRLVVVAMISVETERAATEEDKEARGSEVVTYPVVVAVASNAEVVPMRAGAVEAAAFCENEQVFQVALNVS